MKISYKPCQCQNLIEYLVIPIIIWHNILKIIDENFYKNGILPTDNTWALYYKYGQNFPNGLLYESYIVCEIPCVCQVKSSVVFI